MGLKLLHCADLHLDAVLSNSVRTSQQEYISSETEVLLRDAPLLALQNIAKIAVEENVDLVAIAGDLFNMNDEAAKNDWVRSHLLDFFKTLQKNNIHACVVVGNHDPLRYIAEISNSWPKNVHLFNNKKPETFIIDHVDYPISVHGVSYESAHEERNLASMFPDKTIGNFNIGLLHTNVGNINHANYAPSDIKTLCSFGYDYFALGHIHKREELCEFPMVGYSGNHQGFSAKPSETEPKGVMLIEIKSPDSKPISKFIETNVVRYVSEEISLEKMNSVEEMAGFIYEYLQSEYNDIEQYILCRLEINLIDYQGTFLDADDLENIINDNLSNILVTKLKVVNSSQNLTELADVSEYYKCVQEEINSLTEITFDELYGKQSSKIQNLLIQNNSENNVILDTEFLYEVEANIAKTNSEILGKK